MKKILVVIGIIILAFSSNYIGAKWYAEELKRAKINENILASNTVPQPIIIRVK